MRNWTELPYDILGQIVDHFLAIEDFIHFGAICQAWRSILVEKLHFLIADPWLMLAEKEDSDNRGFYRFSTKKFYHMNFPEARGRRCWSSCGWLITLGLDLEIHLLNIFSRVQIRLPAQPTLPNQYKNEDPKYICQTFIRKVVLSSRPLLSAKTTPPEDEKCVVMVIFSMFNKLAFLKLGDEAWTPIHTTQTESRSFHDVIYMNGQFYAFSRYGKLVIVDIFSPHPKTIDFAEQPEDIDLCATFYLVESMGDLFLLERDIYCGDDNYPCDNYPRRTLGFVVYKFNFDDRKWTEVKTLNNCAFFVGVNNSFAIFPSNHSGCKPNCIYFTDDDVDGLVLEGAGSDMGVFQMENEELGRHYVGSDIISRICAALWISPSL